MEKLLTIYELAAAVGITVTTIYKYVKNGCPYTKDGESGLMFDEAKVRAWHDENILTKYTLKARVK